MSLLIYMNQPRPVSCIGQLRSRARNGLTEKSQMDWAGTELLMMRLPSPLLISLPRDNRCAMRGTNHSVMVKINLVGTTTNPTDVMLATIHDFGWMY
jgi:hypothetical protein